MSTTTDERPRTLDKLLALDTYQGMTDAEIDIILDYKIKQAVTEREVLARIELQIQTSEQIIADNRRSAQEAHDMLQSIIEAEFPKVKPLEPKRFEPRSLEV